SALFQSLIVRKVTPVGAQVRTVAADVPHVGTDVGAIPLDIRPVGANVRAVTRDFRLLVFPGALLGVLMPQVGSVRAYIAEVFLDAAGGGADTRPVVGDVTLVRRDVPPVGIDVRLQGVVGRLRHVAT